jgi:hypothetical protein
MALSPKMLAVLKKVDAARAELFAGFRASTKRDAEQVRAQKAARKKPPRLEKSRRSAASADTS